MKKEKKNYEYLMDDLMSRVHPEAKIGWTGALKKHPYRKDIEQKLLKFLNDNNIEFITTDGDFIKEIKYIIKLPERFLDSTEKSMVKYCDDNRIPYTFERSVDDSYGTGTVGMHHYTFGRGIFVDGFDNLELYDMNIREMAEEKGIGPEQGMMFGDTLIEGEIDEEINEYLNDEYLNDEYLDKEPIDSEDWSKNLKLFKNEAKTGDKKIARKLGEEEIRVNELQNQIEDMQKEIDLLKDLKEDKPMDDPLKDLLVLCGIEKSNLEKHISETWKKKLNASQFAREATGRKTWRERRDEEKNYYS